LNSDAIYPKIRNPFMGPEEITVFQQAGPASNQSLFTPAFTWCCMKPRSALLD